MKITVYGKTYEPWEEHQDEPTRIAEDEETFEFENLTEAVEFLRRERFTEYSSYPFSVNGWYSAESYQHPYTGELTERSAHLDGFAEFQLRRVYNAVIGDK